MIAHDMRTPLNALSLSLATAIRLADGQPELVNMLQMATRNTKAVGSLVEHLLATSEHRSWSKGPLCLRECRPSDLIASAIDQVSVLAAAKSQSLESEELMALSTLVADGERLTRVLVNLLSNAIKFTPEGGRILVDANERANDGHPAIVFSVIDEGKGVAPENVDHIFQPGVSIAEPGRSSTGLGLSVCKEIVEAHDGRIWVDTEYTGGATFSFAIPHGLDVV